MSLEVVVKFSLSTQYNLLSSHMSTTNLSKWTLTVIDSFYLSTFLKQCIWSWSYLRIPFIFPPLAGTSGWPCPWSTVTSPTRPTWSWPSGTSTGRDEPYPSEGPLCHSSEKMGECSHVPVNVSKHWMSYLKPWLSIRCAKFCGTLLSLQEFQRLHIPCMMVARLTHV